MKKMVKKAMIYNDYDIRTEKNDIAILELKEMISFDDENVSPVCLPSMESMYEEAKAFSYGFGQTEEKEEGTAGEAQVVNVTVQSSEYCMKEGTGWKMFDKKYS